MEAVHKVTLSSGKVVLIRDIKMRHIEMSVRVAGSKSGKNDMLRAWNAQLELIKTLIVQIDGVDVPKAKLEDLDSLFTMKEIKQLFKFLDHLQADEDEDDLPKSETVTIGGK